MTNKKTFVCNRARMFSFLRERGFKPYKIAPDRKNPRYSVFLFDMTPELGDAVLDYISKVPKAG